MKAPLSLLLALACCSSLTARDWPQWRGPNRDAKCSETGLNLDWTSKPPQLLWTADGFGKGYAGFAVAGDTLYTTGNLADGQAVFAARLADGKLRWAQTLTASVPRHSYEGARCTPTIDGDRLYAVLSSGDIVCLKTSDGSTVWRKNFKSEFGGRMMSGWGYSESPLVDGDLVLCTPGGNQAMIVALDKHSGDTVWQTAVPQGRDEDNGKEGAGYSSIVISHAAGVKQYVTLVGRGVISARASDGALLWRYNPVANKTANIPTVLPLGNRIFCSSGYGTGSALLDISRQGDQLEAREVYFLDPRDLQNHHGGMIAHAGHVYTGHKHGSGFPTCVEIDSGKVKWTDRGPGKGSAAVLFVEDHLVFRYQDGLVALIEASPDAYREKGHFKAEIIKGKCWAHPVILNGLLYLREQDSLMCYDLRK